MNLNLDGKRALVLGATRGIGRAIASGLAAEGANVGVTGRDEANAAVAAATIGKNVKGYKLNSGDLASVDALWQSVVNTQGGCDVLVLNSGGPPASPARNVAPEIWRKNFESMFVGLVRIADHALPGMIERRFGRIIIVASSGVVQPIPNLAISNAVRAAVVAWSKTLASEVAKDGVTVNVLLPGRIHTERVDEIDAGNALRSDKPIDAIRAASIAKIPIGNYGTADEFAAAAVFLASTAASYITGTMLRVDGGMITSI